MIASKYIQIGNRDIKLHLTSSKSTEKDGETREREGGLARQSVQIQNKQKKRNKWHRITGLQKEEEMEGWCLVFQ